ncbi:MAG: hypothetical protein O2780_14660 [Proteobacteria bacterium]|nr:hypothetical protein [Pseudomonadota bacterium]MDA1301582.1 hypothetical protein [Pseudomonadota bacterium]
MRDLADIDFIAYLQRSSGLTQDQCQHLMDEVIAHYSETLEAFVQRRHQELKVRQGLRNEQIYLQIQAEAGARLFAADTPSERQIRRMIYG